MRNNITKDYRKASVEEVNSIDLEAAEIARKLSIEWRVSALAHETAFFTIKDYKNDFPARISFRLITPPRQKWEKLAR